MSSDIQAPAPTARRPRAARPEGQWALGEREPLNGNEKTKLEDNPLNVRARIETTYAKEGFASIDGTDLRGRMRWYGLYTQRKPGIDGGRTGSLEPHELDDAAATTRPTRPRTVLPPGPMEESMEHRSGLARSTELRLVRRHHVDLLRTASAACRA